MKIAQYKCDGKDCGKELREEEVLEAGVYHYRTPEEIRHLMENNEGDLMTFQIMRERSIITKKLDLCKECFDKFKADSF